MWAQVVDILGCRIPVDDCVLVLHVAKYCVDGHLQQPLCVVGHQFCGAWCCIHWVVSVHFVSCHCILLLGNA